MLKVFIPNNHQPERKYTLSVLFEKLLNINLSVETHEDNQQSIIQLPNSNKIHLLDDFFSKQKDSYLKLENIPERPVFLSNDLTPENNLPVLWGKNSIAINNDSIHIKADIIASAFYFLSRWEETVADKKDALGRFPDEQAFLIKHNLNMRPLVNEYAYFLMNCLEKLGYNQPTKSRNYTLIPTHDVDKFSRLDSFSKAIKVVAGDVIKRKNIRLALSTFKNYIGIKKGTQKDPFDNFEYLMSLAEKANTKALFFFIPGKLGENDVYYNISNEKVQQSIALILSKGHSVGIHPSMDSFLNKEQLSQEIDRLSQCGVKVSSGRQHYLRYQLPETWEIWESLNLTDNYGMSYHNTPGFRCGIANSFPAFNVKTKQVLNLSLHPTIIMEQALFKHCPSLNDFKETCRQLKNTCQKYNGEFVFLWHPENINLPEWKAYQEILENLYH